MMMVTQSKWRHKNDETAIHPVRCRVANEASLKQVVAWIVTELQVPML